MLLVFQPRHGSRVAANVVLQSGPIVRQVLHFVFFFAGMQFHDIFRQVCYVFQVSTVFYLRLELC